MRCRNRYRLAPGDNATVLVASQLVAQRLPPRDATDDLERIRGFPG
jgi:hypothetical protein